MKAPQLLRPGGQSKTTQRWEPPDREWLEYHYITLDMSAVEMAEIVGTSDQTILKWLHGEGLARNFVEAMARRRGRRAESRSAYNHEARRILQDASIPECCAWCDQGDGVEVHHSDHDWHNQSLENLMWLCVPCHRLEGRLWANQKRGKLDFHKSGDEIHIIITREKT